MRQKRTLADHALWAALPMAQSSQIENRLKMILNRTQSRRTFTRRILLTVLGLGIAAFVPLAMLRPTAKTQVSSLPPTHYGIAKSQSNSLPVSVGFRRYVSPPLPDGTRYTFLYPSYFGKVQPGILDMDGSQRDSVRIDCIGVKPVPWTAVRGKPAISYRMYGKGGASWPAPHEEFCCVVVGDPGRFWPNLPLRTDKQWVGQDGSYHEVSLTDARTHL